MDNVHKIVTDRLRAATVAIGHPDADALTAFSERALPEPERIQLMDHLARCSECREIVALALPAEEPAVQVLRPVRGGLLTWPRLRWALVAAGVVVVGSFGVLRYRATSHPTTAALYDSRQQAESAKEAAAPTAQTLSPTEQPVAVEKREAKSARAVAAKKAGADSESREFDRLGEFAKLQAPRRDEKAGSEVGARLGTPRVQSLPHGPKAPMQQWQLNANSNASNSANAFQYQAPLPASAPATANEQVADGLMISAQPTAPKTATTIGGPVPVNKQNQNLDTLAVHGRSVAPLAPGVRTAGAEVARAKPAEVPATNAPGAASADAYGVSEADNSNFASSGLLVPESARWAINSGGGLQRSFDQGRTWQDVNVTGVMEQARAESLQRAMKSPGAKELAKDKADSRTMPIVFRAVSANGPDVWAGGSEGHLYHSTDAGTHWVRVVPSWRGIELTGDIVNLQFADPQHGRIITSATEIWMTADAGQTWDKQ